MLEDQMKTKPSNKEKLSVTIDAELVGLLQRAAEDEKITVSEIVSRSVRLVTGDLVPHRLEVDLLDNSRGSITLYRRARPVYSKRGVRRGQHVGVRATIVVELPRALEPVVVFRALQNAKVSPKTTFRAGDTIIREPPELRGGKVSISNLALGVVDEGPKGLNKLIDAAASEVLAMDFWSYREISVHRCPVCQAFMDSVAVWEPDEGTSETEWTCVSGHRVRAGGAVLSTPDLPAKSGNSGGAGRSRSAK